MRYLFRYLLVGFLATGMVVDTASAGRWFRRKCCPPPSHPVCVEICPPAAYCPPVECCPVPVVVHKSPIEAPFSCVPLASESYYEHDPGRTPDEPHAQEFVAPPTEPPKDSYREDDQPGNEVVNKPTTEAGQRAVTPPPVSVPQPAAESASPVPGDSPAEVDIDSLFDTPSPPAHEHMPEEDLFDEPASTQNDSTDPVMPRESASEETSQPEEDPLGGLFPPVTEEEAPAEAEPPAAEPEGREDPDPSETPSFDDLFGQEQSGLNQAGGLVSQNTRWWTDDEAKFGCEARMLRATTKSVVLIRNNGLRVSVPYSRLSDDDLRFVHEQVTAKRELLAKRAASEQLASRWAD